jgi:hypothetical protein
MPLWFYIPLHPSAKLSAGEKQALIRGLQATTRRKAMKSKKRTSMSRNLRTRSGE